MMLLGIDIGGTKIAGGLVEARTGRIVHAERIATGAEAGGQAVLARAVDLARRLRDTAKQQGGKMPAAVGVGAGGQIDADTGVVRSATEILPGWTGTPLRQAFAEALSLPVACDNDVNALAIGESRFGAGKGFGNTIFLALGTGVGGAIIIQGRLYRGARGAGGELGHLVLFPDGRSCTCGGRGCLEEYANGAALLRHFQEAGGDAAWDGARIADEARRESDGPAARAVARTGEMLGLGLVSLLNIFDPDRIIIGGGLSDLGDRLLDPARRVIAARALPALRPCPVVVAALGPDAGVVGAAALALPAAQR